MGPVKKRFLPPDVLFQFYYTRELPGFQLFFRNFPLHILCSIRRKVLNQVAHGVPLHRHGGCREGEAGGRRGVDPGGVVHKVGRKGRVLDLGGFQIPGQLMHNGPNHLQVAKFFRAQRSIGNVPKYKI